MKHTFALTCLCLASAAVAGEIDLAGRWSLADEHGRNACAATVPGDVYGALLDAKLIPDPYRGRNELEVQWPRQLGWTFSRTFDVDTAFLAAPSIVLRLEEVDVFCTVKINGETVGTTDNRFRRWDFDVKRFLKVGANTIEGVFASTETRAAELRRNYPRDFGCSFNFVRNMPLVRTVLAHEGWDWGLTLMTTGFCGPVKLLALGADERRIDYVWCDQKFTDDLKHVDVTVFAETVASDGARAVVTNVVAIDHPRLWWPAGMGEQTLTDIPYTVDGKRYVKRLGLRKIEVVTGAPKDPATGKDEPTFRFRVNGEDLFAKGADWIPADALECRLTPERYRNLLESAVRANFNTIRVWGGGLYEKDFFYDLCDELGLLVWQDFMFSCAVYPADAPFLASVRAEAVHQVKRLRDHASLALWCGDNECLGANRWFRGKDLYDENVSNWVAKTDVLADVVKAHDPARLFWPSSPCWGPGDFGDGWNPKSKGDLHYWTVWGQNRDFELYATFTPLFCSEFGFQSFPSPDVAATFCGMKGVDDPDFAHHQKFPKGNERILETIGRYFGEPDGFTNTLYLSQALQTLAIKTAADAWRTQRPRCMGILYWQLNDEWPVASWASVEYGGKWKPLQYYAKRIFAPVTVSSCAVGTNGAFAVCGINDGRRPVAATLEVYDVAFAGEVRRIRQSSVTLAPNAATELCTFGAEHFAPDAKADSSLADTGLFDGAAVTNRFAYFVLKDETGKVLAANDRLFARPVRCALASDNGLRVAVEGFKVTLACEKPCLWVWANANGLAGEFDDNAFTLVPGHPRTITFTPADKSTTPAAFAQSLAVFDLARALK